MPRSRNQEKIEYVINRYDQLFSELKSKIVFKKLAIEVEEKFGKKITTSGIKSILAEHLVSGTHLHDFF